MALLRPSCAEVPWPGAEEREVRDVVRALRREHPTVHEPGHDEHTGPVRIGCVERIIAGGRPYAGGDKPARGLAHSLLRPYSEYSRDDSVNPSDAVGGRRCLRAGVDGRWGWSGGCQWPTSSPPCCWPSP